MDLIYVFVICKLVLSLPSFFFFFNAYQCLYFPRIIVILPDLKEKACGLKLAGLSHSGLLGA